MYQNIQKNDIFVGLNAVHLLLFEDMRHILKVGHKPKILLNIAASINISK